MAFGFGVLRLAPAVFWAMTPRELAAAANAMGAGGVSPPSRSELSELMRKFPDKETGHG